MKQLALFSRFSAVACPVCRGKGGPDVATKHWPAGTFPCGRCLGAGWCWSDRRPPTKCAQTKARASTPHAACDRRQETCPGCGRLSADIGDVLDVRLTRAFYAEPEVDAEYARLREAAKEKAKVHARRHESPAPLP